MGFLRNWWKKKMQKEDPFAEEVWQEEEVSLQRDKIDMEDDRQRNEYVRSCLEQIQDASKTMDSLTVEYSQVTAYLLDMEEIETLPKGEKELLEVLAKAVDSLKKDKANYLAKQNRLSETDYRRMERLEEEVEDGLSKIQEAEEYRTLIKQDLGRLDGERHAFVFRRHEQRNLIENSKGMLVICCCAVAACFVMLFILQALLGLDARIGYILTAAVAALTITILYLKHIEAKKELRRIEKGINKLILLQNRVKIRFVNNTNLLDYLCMKYGVTNGKDLKRQWEDFHIERDEREKLMRANRELDYSEQELLKNLRRLHIKDPNIWLHQTEALIDGKEMVEIRHHLIGRRQKLRKQLDYNKNLAETGRNEIKDIADTYPQYARELLDMVSRYDKK